MFLFSSASPPSHPPPAILQSPTFCEVHETTLGRTVLGVVWKVGEWKWIDEWGELLGILFQFISFIYWDNVFKDYLHKIKYKYVTLIKRFYLKTLTADVLD